MHIAEIDQLSINGTSIIHQARPISKILLAACLIASLIITSSLLKLGILMGVVLLLLFLGNVPLGQVGHLIIYPIIFSLFFAILQFQQSWLLGMIVLLKAVTSALTMLLLITTTPYVDIFGFLSLFMPTLLVDIFLFTYRSLFILIDQIENLLISMKLRGGYRSFNPIFNLRNITGALGILIIRSFEMSERMFRVYSLRGYQGGIPVTHDFGPLKPLDYYFIGSGLIILIGTVIPWNLL